MARASLRGPSGLGMMTTGGVVLKLSTSLFTCESLVKEEKCATRLPGFPAVSTRLKRSRSSSIKKRVACVSASDSGELITSIEIFHCPK